MRKTWGLLLALIAVAVGLASQDVWAVRSSTLPPSQYPFETTMVNGRTARRRPLTRWGRSGQDG